MASPDLQNRALPALRTPPSWKVITPARARTPWLSVSLLGLVAANLGLYVITVAHEASLNRTQAFISSLREENVRLRAELATAESPVRLEKVATSQLSMTHPADSLFLPAPNLERAKAPRVPMMAFGVPEAY